MMNTNFKFLKQAFSIILILGLFILSGCDQKNLDQDVLQVRSTTTESGVKIKAFIENDEVTFIEEFPETDIERDMTVMYKKQKDDIDFDDFFCVGDCAAIYLRCLEIRTPAECKAEYRLCKTSWCGLDDVVVMQ